MVLISVFSMASSISKAIGSRKESICWVGSLVNDWNSVIHQKTLDQVEWKSYSIFMMKLTVFHNPKVWTKLHHSVGKELVDIRLTLFAFPLCKQILWQHLFLSVLVGSCYIEIWSLTVFQLALLIPSAFHFFFGFRPRGRASGAFGGGGAIPGNIIIVGGGGGLGPEPEEI